MTDSSEPAVPRVRRRRLRRVLAALAGLGVVGLIGSEFYLRERYGLGNPPIAISDVQTEYRMRPDGHYRRLGHRIDINAYSMRSDPIEPHRTDPAQRRVLMIGDSVLFGGAYTDQADLATSILQKRLRADLDPSAIVGNVSAGSWGPQNQLGYVNEFGLFDANVVVLVISSHDAFDEVEAFPPTSGVPDREYWLALGEAWERLRPKWTRSGASGGAGAPTDGPPPNHQGASEPCLAALGKLIESIRAAGATPIVALHYERPELDLPTESEGHRLIRETCAAHGVEPLSLAASFREAIQAGENPYRDDVHPNQAGQRAIAAALIGPLEAALRTPSTRPAP